MATIVITPAERAVDVKLRLKETEFAYEMQAILKRCVAAEEALAEFDVDPKEPVPECSTLAYEFFDKAVTWTLHQLVSVLGVKSYATSGGGTETYDGDLRNEINDILRAAKRDDDSIDELQCTLDDEEASHAETLRLYERGVVAESLLRSVVAACLTNRNLSLDAIAVLGTGLLRELEEWHSSTAAPSPIPSSAPEVLPRSTDIA